jgi:hypothetical protein
VFEALPRWVWATLASLAALTLVLGATALIVSLPVLTRLAGSERSLDKVNSIDTKVSQVVAELEGLDLDQLTKNTTPLAGSLDAVDGSVSSMDGQLKLTLAEVVRLRKELAPLIAQAPALAGIAGQLARVEADLRGLSELPKQLTALRANTNGLDQLPGQIAQLIEVLRAVQAHVANLDRKTGPVLIPQ